MTNTLANFARMTTETTGTGTVTLADAVPGFLTFAGAGITNGQTVTYAIEENNQREIGAGTYTASGTTLSRDTVYNSTNGGSKITLEGTAEVFITAAAEDFASILQADGTNTWTGTNTFSGDVTMSGTVSFAGATFDVTEIDVGADDDTPGVVKVYGGGATEDGGIIDIYNAADHDANTEFYRIAPNANGDLKIGRAAGNDDIVLDRLVGNVLLAQLSGVVTVGANDSVPGQILLYGGGNTEAGGSLRWYQAADDDATAAGEYWESIAASGTWVLQREDGTDAISVNADATVNFAQHANGFLATGDSGAVTTTLTSATDVTGSRAADTTYQNTTGRPIFVCIVAAHTTARDIEVSSDNFSSSTVVVGRVPGNNVSESCSFFVPDNWYYRINGTVSTLVVWTEYS